MARVNYTSKEIDYLGRIMRSEALGEGNFGMLLVGNVIVNRVVTRCQPFKKIDTVYKAIFQKGQFEGTKTPLFSSRATSKQRELALKTMKYWRDRPAYKALYFQNPGKGKSCKKEFWGVFAGRYKNHCFYYLDKDNCGL